MKKLFICLLPALTLAVSALPAAAQGTAFTYQGQLQNGGGPANGNYDLVFTLYTTNVAGSAIAGPVTNSATGVTNGLFTTLVDFGSGAFTGTSNWLQIAARTNATGSFVTLAPRQQVTPTPYALLAASAGGLPGLTIQQYSSGAPNLLVGAVDNFIAAGVFGASIGGGTNNSIAASSSWSGLGGGYGNSIAASSFQSWLGGGGGNSIGNNSPYAVIGGGNNNTIQPYSDHAFIGGGGGNVIQGNVNELTFGIVSYSAIVGGLNNNIGVSASYSFLGGGSYNAIQTSAANSVLGGGSQNNLLTGYSFLGGGVNNTVQGNQEETLVGGQANTVNGQSAFLGGGNNNTISANGSYGVLVGGQSNTEGGSDSTVGGGYKNAATGNYATVPGGSNNVAGGVSSFAAGSGAQAANPGEFVWADTSGGLFSPGTANSFNVRASGGVNLVTSGAGVAVDGQKLFAGTNGGALFGLNASQITFGTVPLAQLPAAVVTNNEPIVVLGSLFLNNGLSAGGNLSFSSATPIIYAGGAPLLYSDANNNSAFGLSAGGGGGNNNTALGAGALSGNTTGNNNVATGTGALQNNTDSYNTADGGYALQSNTAGNKNVAVGYNALNANTNGVNNTASGFDALQNSTASYNTAAGGYALQNLTAGNNNIAVGYTAGATLINGSNNIYLGAPGAGYETNVIRIGNGQTTTYISGVIQSPSVTSINITGGSDLAEPFSISTTDQTVSEGEVVVIDEANPGQLKLTDRPYDTRVAGVVSGANGIHPGIQMHQDGLLDGGRNVALTGRVYVQADVSNGAIKPGDMLTTSRIPGRAMRVSDHARAQGAILGKAMTGLAKGRGMVLVLVTLQ